MSNPLLTAEGFTCEELAEALMIKLKPFIQESIRVELEKMNGTIQPDIPPVKKTGFSSQEPEVMDNGRYSLSQTCAILDLSIKTILKYTESGDIKCGIQKHNGRKIYKGSEIKKFWRAQY